LQDIGLGTPSLDKGPKFELLQSLAIASEAQTAYARGKQADTVLLSVMAFEFAIKVRTSISASGPENFRLATQIMILALDHVGRPLREMNFPESVNVHALQVKLGLDLLNKCRGCRLTGAWGLFPVGSLLANAMSNFGVALDHVEEKRKLGIFWGMASLQLRILLREGRGIASSAYNIPKCFINSVKGGYPMEENHPVKTFFVKDVKGIAVNGWRERRDLAGGKFDDWGAFASINGYLLSSDILGNLRDFYVGGARKEEGYFLKTNPTAKERFDNLPGFDFQLTAILPLGDMNGMWEYWLAVHYMIAIFIHPVDPKDAESLFKKAAEAGYLVLMTLGNKIEKQVAKDKLFPEKLQLLKLREDPDKMQDFNYGPSREILQTMYAGHDKVHDYEKDDFGALEVAVELAKNFWKETLKPEIEEGLSSLKPIDPAAAAASVAATATIPCCSSSCQNSSSRQ